MAFRRMKVAEKVEEKEPEVILHSGSTITMAMKRGLLDNVKQKMLRYYDD